MDFQANCIILNVIVAFYYSIPNHIQSLYHLMLMSVQNHIQFMWYYLKVLWLAFLLMKADKEGTLMFFLLFQSILNTFNTSGIISHCVNISFISSCQNMIIPCWYFDNIIESKLLKYFFGDKYFLHSIYFFMNQRPIIYFPISRKHPLKYNFK